MNTCSSHAPMPEFNPCHGQALRLKAMKPRLAWQSGLDQDAWRAELASALRLRLGVAPQRSTIDPVWGDIVDCGNHTRQALHFATEDQVRIAGWLLRPKGIKEPPIVICLQGHSTGAHISVGLAIHEKDAQSIAGGRDFAVQAVNQGFAALAFDQRGFGVCEDRRDESVRHQDLGQFSDNRRCKHIAMTELLMGRTLAGCRTSDVQQACNLIETLENIDHSRIAVMGNSGGGTISYYASCLEPRISVCMASCSLCPYGPSIGSIDHCTDNYLPGALQDFDLTDLSGLIAPRILITVAGIHDPIFPIAAVRKGHCHIEDIYAAHSAVGKCCLVEGDGGHQFYPQPAWQAFKSLSGW